MTVLVVGAGFSGAVIARELAEAGRQVEVIDRRDHWGGNAYDRYNEHGVLVHQYGPHIFHTNNEEVYRWLSRFTGWHRYVHRVRAKLSDGTYVPFPPNVVTKAIVKPERIVNTFYRPYTEKMWGKTLEEVNPRILARVPSRDDGEDRYFPDAKYQCMPADGYDLLFEKILTHRNIRVQLQEPFHRDMEAEHDHVFNSMSPDEYFSYSFGALPYRTVSFEHVHVPVSYVLPCAVVNFTDYGPYTRMTEWAWFPHHRLGTSGWTTLTLERPGEARIPTERYYPVVDNDSRSTYKKYAAMVDPKVTFVGRCGNFAYIDMDQAVSSALAAARRYLSK